MSFVRTKGSNDQDATENAHIDHLQKYHSTLCLSSEFCISIIFIFCWDLCKSQEKLETVLMKNFGGQTKSIMVFLKVAYCLWLQLHREGTPALKFKFPFGSLLHGIRKWPLVDNGINHCFIFFLINLIRLGGSTRIIERDFCSKSGWSG